MRMMTLRHVYLLLVNTQNKEQQSNYHNQSSEEIKNGKL